MIKREKEFLGIFDVVEWLGIIFDMNFIWVRIRTPSSFGALDFFIWCSGYIPFSALGFTYCRNEFTNSYFILSPQRMSSANPGRLNISLD